MRAKFIEWLKKVGAIAFLCQTMDPVIARILLWLALLNPVVAGESYSRWTRESIVELAAEYIESTKVNFQNRAEEIQAQTGEIVLLDYQYFHHPSGADAKRHQKFLDARLSEKTTEAHIQGFLEDFERIRVKLAAAEVRASESWEAQRSADSPEEKEMEHFELFGEDVSARHLGVLLDNSPSMRPHLEALRAEISAVFPEYVPYEVWGSFLRYQPKSHGRDYPLRGVSPWHFAEPAGGQNPFLPHWHNPKIPLDISLHYFVTALERDNLSALRALAELEKVDAIYWFCDFDDDIGNRAIKELEKMMKATGIKLYIHTLKRSPPKALRKLVEENGGAIIRKKIR